jgi:hypothetical protein
MGLEPTTSTLARSRSTTELRPQRDEPGMAVRPKDNYTFGWARQQVQRPQGSKRWSAGGAARRNRHPDKHLWHLARRTNRPGQAGAYA